jgi:hypothetical protein
MEQGENRKSGLEDKVEELEYSDKDKENTESMNETCKICGTPLKEQILGWWRG